MPSSPLHATPEQEADPTRPLVLIVDDDETNLKLARDVLRAAGLATLEATSGLEGVALAVDHVPDVVLMDLRLPDVHGADAARRLRYEPRTARTPVVAMSASRLEVGGAWLRDAGFAGFIEKPIDVAGFPEQVLRYCTQATGSPSAGPAPAQPGPIPRGGVPAPPPERKRAG